MGFLSSLKNLTNGVRKVENKDMMEAVVAGCLLVSFADGSADASEINKMQELIEAHESLSAFKGSEIAATVDRYAKSLKANFAFGQKKMLDEIADIANNRDQAIEVMLIMIAVADADGEIGDKEMKALEKTAKVLRVDLKELLEDA